MPLSSNQHLVSGKTESPWPEPPDRQLSTGLIAIVLLGLVLCISLAIESTRNLPLHRFGVLLFCASFIVSGALRRNRYLALLPRLKTSIFLFFSLSAILFLANVPLPINVISLTIRPNIHATNYTLRQSLPAKKHALISVAASPTKAWRTVHFSLPFPLQATQKPFRISFDTLQHSYDIAEIGYGTRIFWSPVSLHNFRQAEMRAISGTITTLNTLVMQDDILILSSKGHQNLLLHVLADEKYVRDRISHRRHYLLKGAWFTIYLLAFLSVPVIFKFKQKVQCQQKRVVSFLLS